MHKDIKTSPLLFVWIIIHYYSFSEFEHNCLQYFQYSIVVRIINTNNN